MPRFYKRLPGTKPRKLINNDDLQKAVDEVQSGKLNYRKAAEKYGIDKMKIFRKCKQIHQNKCGGQTTLTDNEEAVLAGKFPFCNKNQIPTHVSYVN